MDIQVLPLRRANRSRRLVEQPASVVKELVENTLDTGPTQISVAIEQGGARSIRVQDNDSGVPTDQVETTFSRHATSNLRTAGDLSNIAALGFRGDALHSIAAVSVMVCVTCAADAEAATGSTHVLV